MSKSIVFFDFSNHAKAQVPFLLSKYRFFGTAPDPLDPADPINPGKMEHELRQATHQQRAGGKDDVSLNKLPQINFDVRSLGLSGNHIFPARDLVARVK